GPFHLVPVMAAIGAAIPQKAIFRDGDVVGGALPFPHQNAPAARKRTRQSRWHLGAIASEYLVKQPSHFLDDRFAEATQTALLLGVGDAERKHVTTQRSRRLPAKLLSPERAQRAAGQATKVRDTDLPITAAIAHASLAARWRLRWRRPCAIASRPSNRTQSVSAPIG